MKSFCVLLFLFMSHDGCHAVDKEFLGFQVLWVEPNSPASDIGLEPFFDFIYAIDKNKVEPGDGKERFSADAPNLLYIFNVREGLERDLVLLPNDRTEFGATLRLSSYEHANMHTWQVTEVESGSPGEKAGLKQNSDFVYGYIADPEFEEDTQRPAPLELFVYNVEAKEARKVKIDPDDEWKGRGWFGFLLEYGEEHQIPVLLPITVIEHFRYPSDLYNSPHLFGLPKDSEYFLLYYILANIPKKYYPDIKEKKLYPFGDNTELPKIPRKIVPLLGNSDVIRDLAEVLEKIETEENFQLLEELAVDDDYALPINPEVFQI